jgi:pimeloyl-ACP methyl ester carboxylesterase
MLKAILKLTKRRPAGDPRWSIIRPDGNERIQRPDGTELHVEFYGPREAPPIVLSHGWGLNSAEWNYLKGDLSRDHRLIVWDEPGLGKSDAPANRDYSLEKRGARAGGRTPRRPPGS